MRQLEQYQDQIARLFPEYAIPGEDHILSQTVTFQVTDDCNLACFVAGTKILMDDFSYKNIEDVKIGDRILAFDENTPKGKQLKLVPTTVTHTFIRHDKVRKIQTKDGGEIICTNEHPFLDGRRQWVRAEDINTSKKLTKFLGLESYKTGINAFKEEDVASVSETYAYETVYNLETETHTYIANDFAVHNCNYCLTGDTEIRMADYSLKPIKDIQLGDEVLGFEEYPQKGKQTKVIPAIVEQLYEHKDSVIKLTFEDGQNLNITPNHKILVKRRSDNNKYDYLEAGKLNVGDDVYYLPIIDSKLDIQEPVYDINYKIGYLIAMIKGDGSLKHYNRKSDGCDVFKFRIAVKDMEIIERCKQYLDDLDIPTYLKPFQVSKKYNIWNDAIFANTRYVYNKLNQLIDENFSQNSTLSYYQGYLAGFFDAEGHISKERVIRICNTDIKIINEAIMGLDLLKIPYVIEVDHNGTVNKPLKYNIRITDNLNSISTYRFLKSVSPAIKRKRFDNFLNYSPLKKTKIVDIDKTPTETTVYNIGTSSHTYIANTIAVHNCYQICKGKRRMSFETAKKYIDLIISGEKGFSDYINPVISPGIIIEFIGGEPFMEINLINQVCDYFVNRLIELQHPWATKYMFSICSNGVLYFDEKVQQFLRKWKGHISFSVTIDGNKELHDSCRVFPDGRPSYDLAVAAAKDWMSRGYYMGSKITIAPGNVTFLYDAIKHMVELGYTEINANCVYEKGWEPKHATVLYEEMKRVSDFFLEKGFDFEHDFFCSLYNENFFHKKDENDLQNWCGGVGSMLSCDPDGVLFPCLRYMESSLGSDQEPYSIGDVNTGICQCECHKCRLECLKKIDRRTQSTDECFYCPIAEGCSW